ncbi:hypothetical protein J4T87_0031210 (plasmid) [Rhizobium sp. T1473]|uniref:hypothetical protein n=1 Tax=Rhizobium sp. T1473 TaxID=555321 RepID=UPI001AAEDB19|nr:hypothetical protein [Rhizobium sp. T1473]MCA0806567.1 hypothetical protein [Rhizobium sp. T1473]
MLTIDEREIGLELVEFVLVREVQLVPEHDRAGITEGIGFGGIDQRFGGLAGELRADRLASLVVLSRSLRMRLVKTRPSTALRMPFATLTRSTNQISSSLLIANLEEYRASTQGRDSHSKHLRESRLSLDHAAIGRLSIPSAIIGQKAHAPPT